MDFEEQDYTKSIDLSLWGKILKFAFKYKKYVVAFIFLNFAVSFLSVVFPQLTRYAINHFVEAREYDNITAFSILFISLVALSALSWGIFLWIGNRLEVNIVHDIREKGFRKLQNLSFSYFDKTPVGWIMARMSSDSQKIGDVVAWNLFDLIWSTSLIILTIGAMLLTNVKLTIITIAVMPVMFIASIYFQKRILKGHRKTKKINSNITAAYNEGITGAKTTKTIIREEKNFEEFQELTSSMRNSATKVEGLAALYYSIMFCSGSFAIGFVLWIGGLERLGDGIPLGDLTSFIAYATSMFDPIYGLVNLFSEMQSAQASGERVFTLLETEPDIIERNGIEEIYGTWEQPKYENWEPLNGEIEFKNVSFGYKNGEKIMDNFNLKVKPGEKIALVGETGAGKSTIVNLVCRFYEPTSGELLIDKKDYRQRTQFWLQSNLGYVLQSPHLFSGTIRDNIRYGKLDATNDEIIEAAQKVNAISFIEKLEGGFDYDVGEGGNRLSAGERQLISFARAIIGNPRLFVLDEATSSVDTETEQIIQEAIYSALEGRTSFIVAHRLSTIRSCDRILVINDGKILEEGSHKQLLQKKGQYYNLYMNQFREEEGQKILANA